MSCFCNLVLNHHFKFYSFIIIRSSRHLHSICKYSSTGVPCVFPGSNFTSSFQFIPAKMYLISVQLFLIFSLSVWSSSVQPRQNADYDDNTELQENPESSAQPYIILTKLSGEIVRTGNSSEKIHNELFYEANDPIVSVKVYGMWLFYSEPNFNWRSDLNSQVHGSKVEWVFSADEPKFYEFTFKIQSYRSVGNPDNVNTSSLTLYLGKNFTGPDSLTLGTDYPNLPFSKSKSLIITGNEPWLLYTQANFVQKTLCAVPVKGLVLISDFYLRKNTHALRHISSERKGSCDPAKSRFVYYGLDGTKNSGKYLDVSNVIGTVLVLWTIIFKYFGVSMI